MPGLRKLTGRSALKTFVSVLLLVPLVLYFFIDTSTITIPKTRTTFEPVKEQPNTPTVQEEEEINPVAAAPEPSEKDQQDEIEDYFSFKEQLPEFTFDDALSEEKTDELLRQQLHPSSYSYSGFQKFLEKFELNQKLVASSLSEKCDAFFNELSERDPDWSVVGVEGYSNKIWNMRETMDEAKNQVKNAWKDANGGSDKGYKFDNEEKKKAYQRFEHNVRLSNHKVNYMADSTTIMRVFAKCFFSDREDRDQEAYKKYSRKILSVFTGKLPTFSRSGSEPKSFNNAFPKYDKSNQLAGETSHIEEESNFMEYVRTSVSGKGIVMSGTTKFQKDIIGLINVLRATNNKLPIQIVHLGDLDDAAQKLIAVHASMNVNDYIQKVVEDDSKSAELINLGLKHGSEFPPQEVWFVDIKGCIDMSQAPRFRSFFNKLLAYFFNSFAEVIFMDTDSVILQNPEAFFESPEYKKSGTFFFRDRGLRLKGQYIDSAVVLKLSPPNSKSIDSIFGLPKLSEKTTNNHFLLGWYHFQEAGVVVINKKQHFLGSLMTIPLVIWNAVFNGLAYGDKELYWMGLALAGDDGAEFNQNSAAAAGNVYTDPKKLPNADWSEAHSVCSTHPAHLSDDGKVLWLNSGLKFCKKCGWDKDKDRGTFKGFSHDELKKLYSEPVHLQGAVVPPVPPAIWEPGLPYQIEEWNRARSLIDSLFKDRDKKHLIKNAKKVRRGNNDLKAPQQGWYGTGACENYDYCAFDKVVSYDKDKVYDEGKFYQFDPEDTDRYDFYGKMWMLAH